MTLQNIPDRQCYDLSDRQMDQNNKSLGIIKGIIILLCIAFAAYLLQLHTVSWILSNTMSVRITAILIVFQPELRSALEQLGRKNWVTDIFSTDSRQEELEYTARTLQEISRAAIEMGKVKTGALIVLQREVALGEYERTGIPIDARRWQATSDQYL